jgi:hypothetical protein
MNEILAIWAEWIKPSAGLPTVQWSVLLALAAASGHLLNRYTGLPKVAGYSLVGGFAGLAGFTGAVWPLQGTGLFCWSWAWPWCCSKPAGAFRCAGSATTPWCWCKAWPNRR